MRTRFLAVLLAAFAFHAIAAQAQTAAPRPKAVVELFTSQGCSSCPAADALMVELAKDPDLIALTFPVTYWDYLGWKDTLGQEAFTKRQKFYAKARGDGQVYTPQAVINGAAHVVGSDKAEIDRELARPGSFPTLVTLQEQGETLRVKLASGVDTAEKQAVVWLLPVSRMVTVPIARGENQGRTVSYANVVRGMVRVGEWDGRDATLETPLAAARAADADGYVVIVQMVQTGKYGPMPGAIIGAARQLR